jgi:hypothetical protein
MAMATSSLASVMSGVATLVSALPDSTSSSIQNPDALQARLCGSVTRRFHQSSPHNSVGGAGCRAEAQRRRAKFLSNPAATARQANFHCGENEIRASLISSASVGATPTPATIFREMIQLPDCKSGVAK